jgi:hypothetical protein
MDKLRENIKAVHRQLETDLAAGDPKAKAFAALRKSMQPLPAKRRDTVISILEEINRAPKKGQGDFVGAVYDTTSNDGVLPVALVVGINYGQRATSASIVGRCEDQIGYAKYVAVLGKKRDYHTVVWNFFPYLTKSEWMEDVSNSAEEAERVFDAGYVDPYGVFSDLVHRLQPELIVFHGICSAVPVLARSAIRSVQRTAILVPNLSRPALSRAKQIA